MATGKRQQSGRRGTAPPVASTETWSDKKKWIYGLVGGVFTAVMAGVLVAVLTDWFGLKSTPAIETPEGAPKGSENSAPASASATEQVVAEDPVVTASVSYPRDACSAFVVPGELDSYGPAPESSELGNWVRQRDGATANDFGGGRGTAMILVTLTGYGERPVTITDISFSTSVQEASPLVGTTVSNDCGDQTIARYAEVDLDQSPPQITGSSAVEAPWDEYSTSPIVFPYEVTNSENENLLLIASTAGRVDWDVSITWSNGIESGVLRVDDEGKPFRTARAAEGNISAIPAGGGDWLY